MKKILLIILSVTLVSIQLSCNKEAESRLYIIDSIKLGSTMKDYELHMVKKISFSNKPGRSFNRLHFVTQQFINPSESLDFMMGAYYTTKFNDNDNSDFTDYGLIVPTHSSTKDNLIGLTVIFGRTTNSINLQTLGAITNNIGEPIPYFVQANRPIYIEKIKKLLIAKYGEPTKVTSGESVPMHAFEGNVMNGYMTGKNTTGKLLEWSTDVVNIMFFEGFDNYNFTYNPSENTYTNSIDEDRNQTKTLINGSELTKGYSYLKYELTDDYIKKKKLDQPNL